MTDIVTGVLALATLASLIADIHAIIRGQRKRGVILLLVFTALVIGLGLEARHTAKVESENRLLTDAQARAERFLKTWGTDGRLDTDFVSEGEGEGIAQSAADLMEDISECRPEAYKSARDRIQDARDRAGAVAGATHLDDTLQRLHIWQEAAAAAYEQVRGVATVPPNC